MIDTQHLRSGLALAAVLLLSIPFVPVEAEAQAGSRFRVLVANLQPTDGTRERFGERTSNDLRDLIDLPTHVAMSSRDTDQAARQYNLRLNDLTCATARQLAGEVSVPLVFCGEYHTEGGLIHYTGSFVTVPAGEEFPVDPQAVPEGDTRQAANHILGFFEETIDRLSQISYCGMEFNSQNWDGALQYCTRAVELNPESAEARTTLARTLMELEQFDDALMHFETILEQEPNHSSVLEQAGWVATQVGNTDAARNYYERFLELNPANVQVRLRVAYELAQAGDEYGAMQLLEDGFDQAADNVDLHEQYGSYAFRAALNLQTAMPQQQAQDGGQPSLPPEVAELFRTAISSLNEVIEARGAESRPQYVTNSMRAFLQLGEPENAIALGTRGAEIFPEDSQILSLLADAHNRSGDVDGAITMLNRALEVQPDLANARTRMATWYLQADRVDEGVEAVRAAAAAGEQTPDQLAMILFGHGWNRGAQAGNYNLAIRLFQAAKELDVSPEFLSQLNFFHGYALYQQGVAAQEPNTLASARSSLPMFQQARQYLQQGEQYGRENPSSNLNQILEATATYIEIQEAIIRRGN